MKLLTQSEVAAVLRCSVVKVKYLRLSGRLAYLPGRPVLVSETDLAEFIAAETRKAQERVAKAAPPTPEQTAEAARAAARRSWLRKQHSGRS